MTGMEEDKEMLMSQMNFEKKFGQSAIFVTSTLMEQGGVPPSSSPAALLKEAIHVISCGYEDKTEWGLEVKISTTKSSKKKTVSKYPSSLTTLCLIIFSIVAVGMDLRVYYRGYSNRVQDALPWLEVYILHAKETCI